MIKHVLVISFALFSFIISPAQVAPTITISGESKIKAVPELMVFQIPLEATNQTYEGCSENLTANYNALEKALTKAKFDSDILKTSGFSVQENYRYESSKRIKDGYRGQMTLRIETEYNDKSLNTMIKTLASDEFNYGYSMSFKLSEKQEQNLTETALSQAVLDAKSKAEVMAAALDLSLGSVNKIDQSSQTFAPSPVRYDAMMKAESAPSDVSLNPKEIEIKKNVVVVWGLTKN